MSEVDSGVGEDVLLFLSAYLWSAMMGRWPTNGIYLSIFILSVYIQDVLFNTYPYFGWFL